MRNILLFICVFAFTSVNAQFDINEHLKKKSVERIEKTEKEKPILLLRKLNRLIYFGSTSNQSKSYTLPNGDRIITNPLFNMPVVVTDIKRFQIMPNPGEDYFAKNFYVPGQQKFNDIPNGAAELPLPKKL